MAGFIAAIQDAVVNDAAWAIGDGGCAIHHIYIRAVIIQIAHQGNTAGARQAC